MNQDIPMHWFSPKIQRQQIDLGSQKKPPLSSNLDALPKCVGQKSQNPSGKFLY
jgi:hypothetical protein